MTHAALRSDVEDRYTLFKEKLWSDEWVRAWPGGNATDTIETIAQTNHHLDLMTRLLDALAVVDDILDARNTALEISSDQGTSENESDPVSALERVRDLGPAWNTSGRSPSAVTSTPNLTV